MKVAILGSTGMLGSMVRRFLSERPEYDISVIDRPSFDAEAPFLRPILTDFLRGQDYAINCIGIIKPRIDEQKAHSVERAIRVNSLFPHALAAAADSVGCRVLQIATDCVFSGATGGYTESSPHDALDVYGKTKSLGEVRSPNVHHLRCSIIGPELAGRPKDSLLEWFLGQPAGSMLKGFNNHRWNGVTTLAFAKICHGIMSQGVELQRVQHVVPGNSATKAELLDQFRYCCQRKDIHIEEVQAEGSIDRTLTTDQFFGNELLWEFAGYDSPPTIQQMIEELAAYK